MVQHLLIARQKVVVVRVRVVELAVIPAPIRIRIPFRKTSGPSIVEVVGTGQSDNLSQNVLVVSVATMGKSFTTRSHWPIMTRAQHPRTIWV